jgi:hypothetical protein
MQYTNNNKNKMTAASMAVQETPLNLLSDLPTEIPKVKLNIPTIGGNTEKREVPTSNGDSAELHFYALREYNEMADQLQFNAADHWTHYRSTQTEPLRSQWDSMVVGMPRTIWNCNAQVTALTATSVREDAYEKFQDHLHVVKKPKILTPTQTENRLRVLNLYSLNLPSTAGAVTAMNERQLCNHYFRMMPMSYQTAFKRSGQTLNNATLLNLSTYFDTLHNMEPTEYKPKRQFESNNNNANNERSFVWQSKTL